MGGLSCELVEGNGDVAFHHVARGVVDISLPAGELTDYIGIAEAKLPKEYRLSNVVIFPKKSAKKAPRKCGAFLLPAKPGAPTRGPLRKTHGSTAVPESVAQSTWARGYY